MTAPSHSDVITQVGFCNGCESRAEVIPVGSGPKDAATVRALEERSMLLCHKGGDEGNGIIVRDGDEHDIAVCTAIPSVVVHVKIKLEIPMKLTQLLFEIVADDERVTTAKNLAFNQVPVAREQPPVFPERAVDQRLVRDIPLVCRIVSEYAQPAREATEHRICHEAQGEMAGSGEHV
jgi:hypothetical protein